MPNLTVRVTDAQRQRIEANARQQGQTITDYLLSWLPDTYDRTTEHEHEQDTTQRRGARSE